MSNCVGMVSLGVVGLASDLIMFGTVLSVGIRSLDPSGAVSNRVRYSLFGCYFGFSFILLKTEDYVK